MYRLTGPALNRSALERFANPNFDGPKNNHLFTVNCHSVYVESHGATLARRIRQET